VTPALLPPGIHHGISAEQYHSLPYCSNSRLNLLLRSPAHLQAELAAPREATPAMKLGTAVHMAVLEPERFAAHYTVAGQCEGIKKDKARCSNPGTHRVGGEWRCGVHALFIDRDPVDALAPTDLEACIGIGAALRSHPRIRPLLSGPGHNELTVIWDDAETGVRCKARIDRLTEDFGGVLVDLKTTTDARPEPFGRKADAMGYHRQPCLYQEGLAAHGWETSHMVLVAVEGERPHGMVGYRQREFGALLAREELRVLLRRYAECMESREWPGYPVDIQELPLPRGAWRSMEEVG
jgi:hypothetical protein